APRRTNASRPAQLPKTCLSLTPAVPALITFREARSLLFRNGIQFHRISQAELAAWYCLSVVVADTTVRCRPPWRWTTTGALLKGWIDHECLNPDIIHRGRAPRVIYLHAFDRLQPGFGH